MTFAVDAVHSSRKFQCGWGVRPETALSVARRVLHLNRRLVEIEPEHREIWPLFAARAIKRGRDPGPILELSPEDLADLIDRKARFDPPRYPASVSDTGYRLIMAADRIGPDPLKLGVTVHAGAYAQRYEWNQADIDYHLEHRVWRDQALGLSVLEALIESLEPRWAYSGAFIQPEDDEERGHSRPWLVWAAKGEQAPTWYTERGGPPCEVRPAYGGELRIWP